MLFLTNVPFIPDLVNFVIKGFTKVNKTYILGTHIQNQSLTGHKLNNYLQKAKHKSTSPHQSAIEFLKVGDRSGVAPLPRPAGPPTTLFTYLL